MEVGFFNAWFLLVVAASGTFLGIVIYLLISNYKLKKNGDKVVHSH